MLQLSAKKALRSLGLNDEMANEIAAIAVITSGILIGLSLVSETPDGNLVGSFGSAVHGGLTFIFGKFVAFAVPIIVLIWGGSLWHGKSLNRTPLRVLGLFLTALSICALFAIPHATENFRTDPSGFSAGGALGNTLVHGNALGLGSLLGTFGSYVFFLCILLMALIMLTDARVLHWSRQAVRSLAVLNPRTLWPAILEWTGLDTPPSRYRQPRPTELDDPDMDWSQPEPVAVAVRPRFATRKNRDIVAADDDPATAFEEAPIERRPATARTPALAPAARKPQVSPVTDPDDLVSLAESGGLMAPPATINARYDLPSLEFLTDAPRSEARITRDEIEEISSTLERTLAEFGISAQVVNMTHGPTVMRFELQPAAGVKVARIASLENDIALCMKAESVRIIAPIPGKAAVGIEIPSHKPTKVVLSEILRTDAFENHPSPLAFALGKTISGEPYLCDLATMPHLLIAGTTGSGKSVCLNSVIVSMLYRMGPEKVKFIMIDPKRVELNVYRDIPHLLAPVVCDPRKAAAALTWAIEQMEERYKRLAELGVRNIDGYNAIVRSHKPHPKANGRNLEYMPHIVIVVDELADLMIIARNEVEDSIIRLAQMSRAVGMHLIIATQRPSVNVITGIIKANFPCRVAFQVSSKVDSRTILDMNGAESLLGRGDMLFSPAGTGKPIRIQGCFVSDAEVEAVADHVRTQQKPQYLRQDFNEPDPADYELAMNGIDADDGAVDFDGDDDDDDSSAPAPWEQRPSRPAPSRPAMSSAFNDNADDDGIDEALFNEGAKLILRHRKASVSLMQRKLKIGFARAGRLMDMMEEQGIVGPNVGSKVREILVDSDEYLAELENRESRMF